MSKRRDLRRIVAGALALAAALTLCAGLQRPGHALAAGRVGGDFGLERVEARFVGGEKFRVIAAGREARAEAEITFRGAGQLAGAWEIAEPNTTAGSPRFRTLELVSRQLGMGRREVLGSPPLPTAAIGVYHLRLRITQPESAGPPLTLKYFVAQPDLKAAAGAAPAAILARGPAAGVAADGLKFSWEPVAGSIAYQLEIYEKDAATAAGAEDDPAALLIDTPSALGRPPVTGAVVHGAQTEVTLGQLAVGRLIAGRTYLWRVVALDRDGKFLRDSPLQELAR